MLKCSMCMILTFLSSLLRPRPASTLYSGGRGDAKHLKIVLNRVGAHATWKACWGKRRRAPLSPRFAWLARHPGIGSEMRRRALEGCGKRRKGESGFLFDFICKASKVCLAFMCGIPIAEPNGHLIGGLLRRCPSRRLFDTVASLPACSAGVLIGA